jgi:hypothetical protein
MNNKKPISPIEENVMSRIKTGKVKMHPKIYYSLVSLLSVAAIMLMGVVSAYAMSVVTLWLRIQAAQGPAYGAKRNLANLVDVFPWWALLLGVISLVAIVYLIRKFRGLYKIKLTYLILIVVMIASLIGFALSYSSLPNTFNRRAPACVVCNVIKMK